MASDHAGCGERRKIVGRLISCTSADDRAGMRSFTSAARLADQHGLPPEGCQGDGRSECVDPDAVRCPLSGETPSQIVHSSFGSAVRGATRAPDDTGLARDVDDGAPVALADQSAPQRERRASTRNAG